MLPQLLRAQAKTFGRAECEVLPEYVYPIDEATDDIQTRTKAAS